MACHALRVVNIALSASQTIFTSPDQERTLIERYYFDDVTFDQAARELGLSKSWASRLHARAIEGVAKALKRSGIDGG